MKVILLVHRYLAVCVGILMVLWCLSGFVMMYQSYPELDNAQRLNGLEPLDFTRCCNVDALQLDAAAPAGGFRVEMLLDEPVIRLSGRSPATSAVSLRTGAPVGELPESAVLDIARRFGEGNGIDGIPGSRGVIDMDQWTLQTARRNAPTYHVVFNDQAGTEIYVSGASGEVFQMTNRRLRILGWLGAVPHWIYPTLLRQNGQLWTNVVIWTSIAGTFLAATGMYVGLSRIRRNKLGELASPYRGWWYWHHVSGLLFGVLALTWVFSGLMTMNPWGALSGGGGGGAYRETITGSAPWSDVQQFLRAAPKLAGADYRQLQPAVFAGELYMVAVAPDGARVRLDANATRAPLGDAEVRNVVSTLPGVRELSLMNEEDSYYYGHKRDISLPVWRALMDDTDNTRLYIDRETGSMRAIGSAGRLSRWIRTGLHDMDFPILRIRPVWDIVVGLLLAGVTALCMIGTWLAIKRVRMDFRLYRAKLRRRFGGAPAVTAHYSTQD